MLNNNVATRVAKQPSIYKNQVIESRTHLAANWLSNYIEKKCSRHLRETRRCNSKDSNYDDQYKRDKKTFVDQILHRKLKIDQQEPG